MEFKFDIFRCMYKYIHNLSWAVAGSKVKSPFFLHQLDKQRADLSFRMLWELLVLSTMPIKSAIASTSIWDSDSIWPSEDLSDSDLPLNEAPFSSYPALSTSDQSASIFEPTQLGGESDTSDENTFDSLFSNTDNSIHTSSASGIGYNGFDLISSDGPPISDVSLDFPDCSTSMPFPATAKSRVRRLKTPESCENPTSGADVPPLGPGAGSLDEEKLDPEKLDQLGQLLQDPETSELLNRATSNPDNNPYCYLLTNGLLPWGVCSSEERDETIPGNDAVVWPGFGRFRLHRLTQCTLGTVIPPPCPLSSFTEFKPKFASLFWR